jgi:hypothetical protein
LIEGGDIQTVDHQISPVCFDGSSLDAARQRFVPLSSAVDVKNVSSDQPGGMVANEERKAWPALRRGPG